MLCLTLNAILSQYWDRTVEDKKILHFYTEGEGQTPPPRWRKMIPRVKTGQNESRRGLGEVLKLGLHFPFCRTFILWIIIFLVYQRLRWKRNYIIPLRRMLINNICNFFLFNMNLCVIFVSNTITYMVYLIQVVALL